MKTLHGLRLSAAVMLASILALPVAYAQMGPGPGSRARMYNPATETTLSGTVEEVKDVAGRHGWHGIHLTLKTADKTTDIHLGPAAFLKERGCEFTKGDQVEVTGSKVSYHGSEAIIAREVKKGGQTLVLRDAQGIPAWSMRGRR